MRLSSNRNSFSNNSLYRLFNNYFRLGNNCNWLLNYLINCSNIISIQRENIFVLYRFLDINLIIISTSGVLQSVNFSTQRSYFIASKLLRV